MQILFHDAFENLRVVLQSEAAQRVGQRLPRDDGKILIAPHQRTQPGIFQLLDAPDLGDDFAIAWKRLLGDFSHRLDVVQRPIGVEHNGLDGHSAFALSPICSPRKSCTASAARSAADLLYSRRWPRNSIGRSRPWASK